MKAILLSLALFGLAAVAPVYAGGSLDVLGESAYDAQQAKIDAEANVGIYGSTSTAMQNEAMGSTTANSASGSGSVPAMAWPIALVVLIVAAASGFLYWYSRGPRA